MITRDKLRGQFSKILKNLLTERGISSYQIAKECSIDNGSAFVKSESIGRHKRFTITSRPISNGTCLLSFEPPYVERHVWWCERSEENKKISILLPPTRFFTSACDK